MNIIDISVAIDNKLPIWPGGSFPQLDVVSDMGDGKQCNETKIKIGTHTGTHIDAPLHFIKDGSTVDKLPLDIFIGDVFVAEFRDEREITSYDIEKLDIPEGVSRILFKTSNSKLWEKEISEFKEDYVGLTEDAAKWLVDHNIKLVGVDYLSVAKYGDIVNVHKIILGAGIVALEGINLSGVEMGNYQLVCLPIKIPNTEGSLVRAVLLKL